jgi:hypothetical protein
MRNLERKRKKNRKKRFLPHSMVVRRRKRTRSLSFSADQSYRRSESDQ